LLRWGVREIPDTRAIRQEIIDGCRRPSGVRQSPGETSANLGRHTFEPCVHKSTGIKSRSS
jgi:hypothetical protein